MTSAMLEQVAIMAFDLDHAEVQDKLVHVHGRVMTVAELRDALIPKTRKVRQEAVGMRHLYDAIQGNNETKTKHIFNRLCGTMEVKEILERLDFHMLRTKFDVLMSGVI